MTQGQTLFQDAMDPTRLIKPLESNNGRVLCKVYWKGKGNQLNYGGTTTIAYNLLTDSPANKRIGFY